MENFEKHTLVETEQAIAHNEITPRNRNENQIRLATDLFESMTHTTVDLKDTGVRNSVMDYWVEEGFSKAYRELEKNSIFINHPRLKGDIFKITLRDIIQYRDTGTLPE